MSDDPKKEPSVPVTQTLIVSAPIPTESRPSNPYLELQELNLLPDKALRVLPNPDSLGILMQALVSAFPPSALTDTNPQQRTWELVGLVYRDLGRHYEALSVFKELYYHMLKRQQETSARCHKGTPLCWMSDCYLALGYPLMSLRYLMLTLVEDAITTHGQRISPQQTGVYWRLVFRGWLSEDHLNRYAGRFYALYNSDPNEALFPESVLQKLDDNSWITWGPTPSEAGIFDVNVHYLQYLMARLGDGSGKILEHLAEYLLACMPGCRTARRLESDSTDYDVVCAMEGLESNFRSELGRYFICELKWTPFVRQPEPRLKV
jgi:hypothetical protein